MVMFARIHPVDLRRGHKVERYVVGGVKFEVIKGWYRISDRLAEVLRGCLNDMNAPIPVPVFQVATEEEARRIERDDYERQNPERKISDAIAGAQDVPESKVDLPEASVEEENATGEKEPLDLVDDGDLPFGS